MEDKWIFDSRKTYSRDEIEALASSVEEDDDYLVAMTPGREYWFFPCGSGYRVNHTWASFILGEKEDG
jgi:hypothetical protein